MKEPLKRLLERGGRPGARMARMVGFALLGAVWLSSAPGPAAAGAPGPTAPPPAAFTASAGQCSALGDPIRESPAFILTLHRDVAPIRLIQTPDLLDVAGVESRSDDGISGAGLTYSLSDHWTANLKYKHAFLFDTGSDEALRQSQYSDFSTDTERDVLNLDMSWRLSWSTLDLGYRFQSVRGDHAGADRGLSAERGWLPDFQDSLHSLTLGVTKTWGGSP
jgi:hypothetical protein